MRRLARRVRLDFAGRVDRAPVAGAALLLAGVAAALAVGATFARTLSERQRLEASLQAAAVPRRAPPSAESRRQAAEVAVVDRELGVPWTRLLSALETASHDSEGKVALLGVEPDPAKRTVRITAEVRALDDALDYLERLQACGVLRYPMLESHEVRKDDPDHALRIRIAAEWRS